MGAGARRQETGAVSEDFSALPALLQHRALLRELDCLEWEMSLLRASWEADEAAPVRGGGLATRLQTFAQNLALHFAGEGRTSAELGAESPDAGTFARLRALDAEHPHLLGAFFGVLELLNHEVAAVPAVIHQLERAIHAFRAHEAREDELFGS